MEEVHAILHLIRLYFIFFDLLRIMARSSLPSPFIVGVRSSCCRRINRVETHKRLLHFILPALLPLIPRPLPRPASSIFIFLCYQHRLFLILLKYFECLIVEDADEGVAFVVLLDLLTPLLLILAVLSFSSPRRVRNREPLRVASKK